MAEGPLRRVGVLTAGGDCPGLNAVIRAFVKTAEAHYDWEILGILDGFEGLLVPDGVRPLRGDDVQGHPDLRAARSSAPAIAATRSPCARWSTARTQVADRSAEVVARLKELDVGALVVIGGDGSMRIALRFQQLGVPIVGVPKTIDNDLAATDVTFGFDTAVATATDAIDRLRSTAEAHHRVMIVEVMGRDAGWIALEAGLAGGGDVILIPEIPFRVDRVARAIEQRSSHGRTFSIVVVAEGAYPGRRRPDHAEAAGSGRLRAPRRRRGLAGRGAWAAHPLRGPGDRPRATSSAAARRPRSTGCWRPASAARRPGWSARATSARWSRFTAPQIVPVPIEDCVRIPKRVPPAGDRVMTARYLGVSFGD